MRKLVSLAGLAGVLVVAACNSKDAVMSDDLKKDLDAASQSNAINLAGSQQGPGSQVVSAIERVSPPAPKQIAQSQRVVKHKAAPKAPPAAVEVQHADVSTETAPQPVEVTPAPVQDPAPLPSPRPQPVATSGTGDVGRGGGSNIGSILGGIFTVVIRGGGVDGDQCDPRTDGRHGGNTAINNRIPIIGTFPGSGRIGGGDYPSTGRGMGGPMGRGRGRF